MRHIWSILYGTEQHVGAEKQDLFNWLSLKECSGAMKVILLLSPGNQNQSPAILYTHTRERTVFFCFCSLYGYLQADIFLESTMTVK